MDMIFILLPLSLFLAVLGFGAWVWAWKKGQFEDLDTPQIRMLFEDKEEKKN